MRVIRTTGALGYALGSGSAKGFAHIGVLSVLEEIGIRPQVIAGSSIGAIVGAFYAAGYSALELRELALSLDLRELMTLSDLRTRGRALANGDTVERFLRARLPATFEELSVPFGCVSSDLRSGERVLHTTGDLPRAIRASLSVPALFSPVESDGRLLIDGGVTEPVPIAAAKEIGAGRIIAVTLYGQSSSLTSELTGGGTILERLLSRAGSVQIAMASVDLMQARIAEETLGDADIVIRPDVNSFSQLSWLNAEELIENGERATRACLEAIRDLAGA